MRAIDVIQFEKSVTTRDNEDVYTYLASNPFWWRYQNCNDGLSS